MWIKYKDIDSKETVLIPLEKIAFISIGERGIGIFHECDLLDPSWCLIAEILTSCEVSSLLRDAYPLLESNTNQSDDNCSD